MVYDASNPTKSPSDCSTLFAIESLIPHWSIPQPISLKSTFEALFSLIGVKYHNPEYFKSKLM